MSASKAVYLLKVAYRHFLTVLVTFFVACIAIGGLFLSATGQYTSTVKLRATYAGKTTSEASNMNSVNVYIQSQLKSYPNLIKAEDFLQSVIDDLHLDMTTKQLANEVNATIPVDSYLISITVTDADPRRAADLVTYISNALSKQAATFDAAYKTDSKIRLKTVETAKVADASIKTRIIKASPIIVTLSLLLALFASILKERLNRTLISVDQLKQIGRYPVVGQIEVYKPDITADQVSLSTDYSASGYQTLITNLLGAIPNTSKNGEVIVVSSLNSETTKTAVTYNLAEAIAESGSKVLLIDADMNKSSIAYSLSLDGRPGLSQVLQGSAVLTNCIYQHSQPNFHILTAGIPCPNASTLLNSRTMTVLMQQASTHYDYVILETDSLANSNDCFILAGKARGLMMVVQENKTSKRAIEQLDERPVIQNHDSPFLGLVYTKVVDSVHKNKACKHIHLHV